MAPAIRRRAVVTGLGVIAPGGNCRKAFWEHVTSDVSAIREEASHPCP